MRRVLAAMILAATLPGCPRDLKIPEAMGEACEDDRDCNPTATCGTLSPCVLLHCSTERTLFVPCDGGTLTDASNGDAR